VFGLFDEFKGEFFVLFLKEKNGAYDGGFVLPFDEIEQVRVKKQLLLFVEEC
jgi:hypothetical protein